jgi:hypothetical protein
VRCNHSAENLDLEEPQARPDLKASFCKRGLNAVRGRS